MLPLNVITQKERELDIHQKGATTLLIPSARRTKVNQTEPLSEKQLIALPVILGAKSITEGCREAEVSKTTFYEWMKTPDFKAEFIRQRNELVSIALDELKACTGEAVQALRELLKSKKETVRLKTATAILDHVGKFIELEEIEERLAEIERRLDQ